MYQQECRKLAVERDELLGDAGFPIADSVGHIDLRLDFCRWPLAMYEPRAAYLCVRWQWSEARLLDICCQDGKNPSLAILCLADQREPLFCLNGDLPHPN